MCVCVCVCVCEEVESVRRSLMFSLRAGVPPPVTV